MPVEELVDTGHRHHQGTGLPGAFDVVALAAVRRDGLGDQGVEFVEARVHRAEALVVQPGEVLHLDPEALHRDLELDQRLLGHADCLLQAVLRTLLLLGRRLAVGFRHPPSLRGPADHSPGLPPYRSEPPDPNFAPEVVNLSIFPSPCDVSCLPGPWIYPPATPAAPDKI